MTIPTTKMSIKLVVPIGDNVEETGNDDVRAPDGDPADDSNDGSNDDPDDSGNSNDRANVRRRQHGIRRQIPSTLRERSSMCLSYQRRSINLLETIRQQNEQILQNQHSSIELQTEQNRIQSGQLAANERLVDLMERFVNRN